MKGPHVNSGSGIPGSTSTSLLERLRGAEPDAWLQLADLYGPLVYAWCRRRGLRSEDAEDVVQEVFRSVAAKIVDFQRGSGGSFRGWLWTITRNKILDHFRRRQRRPEAVGGTDANEQLAQIPESLEESEAESDASSALVRRGLDMIRPNFTETTWQAFWQVAMEGHAPVEVAQRLGLSVNAVFIAKSRVLQRLRAQLGEDPLASPEE